MLQWWVTQVPTGAHNTLIGFHFFFLHWRTSCSRSLWTFSTAQSNMMCLDKTFTGTASGLHSLHEVRIDASSAGTQYKLPCLQFRAFKGGLKIRTENLCVPGCCPPLDFTSLNCDYREVSLSLLFIAHKQLLKGEVYNYALREWAWPTFWVI